MLRTLFDCFGLLVAVVATSVHIVVHRLLRRGVYLLVATAELSALLLLVLFNDFVVGLLLFALVSVASSVILGSAVLMIHGSFSFVCFFLFCLFLYCFLLFCGCFWDTRHK